MLIKYFWMMKSTINFIRILVLTWAAAYSLAVQSDPTGIDHHIYQIEQNSDRSLTITLSGMLGCDQEHVLHAALVEDNIINVNHVIATYMVPTCFYVPDEQYYLKIDTEPLEYGEYVVNLRMDFVGDYINYTLPLSIVQSTTFTVAPSKAQQAEGIPVMNFTGYVLLITLLFFVTFMYWNKLK